MVNQMKYIANKRFTYDGIDYQRGDEWEPGGFQNDRLIIDIGYVREVTKPLIIDDFYCQECKRKFKSKAGLKAHRRAKHDG